MTSFGYIIPCPFTLLHLLPTKVDSEGEGIFWIIRGKLQNFIVQLKHKCKSIYQNDNDTIIF